MQLKYSTWPQIERYLERSTGVMVPVGSIEQHGPAGLIGTDAICAEQIARRVGEHADVLVAPTIELGVAQFNLSFPGTVSLRAETLMRVVTDYVNSLTAQGFTQFYLLNGHGGNIAPVNAAFQDLYAERSLALTPGNRPPIRCRLRSWWEFPRVNSLRNDLYGEWEGMHATPSEIAITRHVFPDQVDEMALARPPQLDAGFYRDFGGDRHYDAAHHRAAFPDGRIGADSTLANATDGARLMQTVVPEVGADYAAFVAETSAG